jgi:hypothetical protein
MLIVTAETSVVSGEEGMPHDLLSIYLGRDGIFVNIFISQEN